MSKPHFSKWIFVIAIVLIGSFVFINIQGPSYDTINAEIDAQSIVLGMTPDAVFETLGERPEQEMCVYGYEYTFTSTGLNIGFRTDGDTVRRITIRNTHDTILGCKVGESVDGVLNKVSPFGFEPDPTTMNRYKYDDLYFTAVSKEGQFIDQVILEIIDDKLIEYAY